MGNGTPITPVDATTTSAGSHRSAPAAQDAVSRASRRPCSPVAALAQPALTTTARARPVPTCSRDTTIGAAAARFWVKTPAAEQGPSATSEGQIVAAGPDPRGHRGRPEARGMSDHRRFGFEPTGGVSTSTAFTSTGIRSRVSARTRSGRPKRRMKPSASWWS